MKWTKHGFMQSQKRVSKMIKCRNFGAAAMMCISSACTAFCSWDYIQGHWPCEEAWEEPLTFVPHIFQKLVACFPRLLFMHTLSVTLALNGHTLSSNSGNHAKWHGYCQYLGLLPLLVQECLLTLAHRGFDLGNVFLLLRSCVGGSCLGFIRCGHAAIF